MKSNLVKILILAFAVTSVSLERAAAQALDLSLYTTGANGLYTNTFDSLGYSTNQTTNGLPGGQIGYLSGEWTCYINATINSYGSIAAGAPNVSSPGTIDSWTNPFVGQFKNYASYVDYIGNSNFYTNNALPGGTNLYGAILDTNYQINEPNRALGVRQTGGFGDPGASFVLKLLNTSNYHNFKISVDLINLDPTSPRSTTWHLQYGIADPVVGVPAAFQDLPISFNSTFINVPGTFHWKTIRNVTIPEGAINNINDQVWLRIVTYVGSTGTGNRESFAIDNFGLTWQTGNPGCVPATNAITITAPAPPIYSNSTVSFAVNTAAQQPLYYQWRFNGVNVDQVFSSDVLFGNSYRSSTLTLQNVTGDQNGSYDCVISNVCSGSLYVTNSPSAVLTVTNIPPVSIGFLRTLTDKNNGYAPTVPLSSLYQVTGIITTVTNTTSGDTSSYYIEDATGGMNLFVTGGSSFRPQIGDVVTAAGFLSGFQGNLEIEADLNDATHASGNTATSVQILSNNIAGYPVAKVLDWPTEFFVNLTNNTVEQGTTNGSGQLTGLGSKKGSICMLQDVYFGTNAGHVITGNWYAYVTNATGLGGWVYFWADQDQDLVSNTIPAFAYSVQGPLFTREAGDAGSFWSGIGVSKWADVVTTPLIVHASWAGSAPQITWSAVAQTYSYSVLAASALTGPFTNIATGLKFPDANGTYTDPSAGGQQRFYRVTSP
jgi:hypothetical protein